MMSVEQENAVKFVYRNFITHDYRRGWTEIDDRLYELSFLNDDQTILETETQVYMHSVGNLKCAEDHGESTCIVPQLMDSVNAICELFQETQQLHPKNRYILHNYLAVSHQKIIYTDID